MNIKVEIWQYGSITDTFESNNENEVLKWFKRHWSNCYDDGGCAVEIYKNDKRLSYHEICDFGIY